LGACMHARPRMALFSQPIFLKESKPMNEKDAKKLKNRLRRVKTFLDAISLGANRSDDEFSFFAEPLADEALEDLKSARKIVRRLAKTKPAA
jgi:hypothetical protein